MTLDERDGRRGIAPLLRDLAESSAALVRHEARLVKVEIADIVATLGRGAMLVAGGGVLVLIGGLSVIAGIVLLIGDQWLPADRYWLSALIVMLITGSLAVWLAKRGSAIVSPSRLVPNETITTLKEDSEWLKRRLT